MAEQEEEQPQAEPQQEEEQQQEAAAADEEPAADDAPAVDDAPAPADDEAADAAPQEQAEEAVAAEEVKEEPKDEPKPAPKKKGNKKKKKGGGGDSGASEDAQALWDEISSKKGTDMNWYALELSGKIGASTNLKEVSRGTGGALEIIEFVKDKANNILFILLKAVTTDDSKSVRTKFIFIRLIGSGVATMKKAKITPSLGKIGDSFPCKHLTLDLSENCEADITPEKLARELLRVGGAHKPDLISFGPGQDIDVKSYKNN
mmetsp:Transcript_21603/g.34682  ORF Transcript_21603/g.34682 Transcript_21603/m.34682 type:complete len:261 (-) Transcript_21603:156-938(-)